MDAAPVRARRQPNQRMKLSCRSSHFWWNQVFLIVAAPARSLCAIRYGLARAGEGSA
jgi:hypothetical protein